MKISRAAEISDRLIYTDNKVDHRHKATVERHCRSMGHPLCCVGQKDEVDGMWWWEQPLPAAPALGFGRRLDAGQGMQRGSGPEVYVEGQVTLLSQHY